MTFGLYSLFNLLEGCLPKNKKIIILSLFTHPQFIPNMNDYCSTLIHKFLMKPESILSYIPSKHQKVKKLKKV